MRRAIVIALAAGAALAGGPAAAPAATVDVMVVGKSRTLQAPTEVRLRTQRVRVRGRSCAVAGATPLAALLRSKPPKVTVRDYGSCGRSTRDAGGLFVTRIGPDRNRGQDGWVYKVGRRTGTAGAGDRAGPFGNGRRLRDGQRVVWFWCELSGGESCARTLEVSPAARRVSAGGALRVTVRGYDDNGRGTLIEGATVRLGGATAVTGADGVATVTPAPGASGRQALSAEAPGAVPSFDRPITVG